MGFASLVERVNEGVARSKLGNWFRLEGSTHPLSRANSRFLTEIRAGAVTFAAMAYIISVNASILSNTGGPCVCPKTPQDPVCSNDAAYQICKNEVYRDYVVATSAIATIATGLMGLLAGMPLGLAPGLGVNAYFAFTVVGVAGTGLVTYGEALAAVFIEGLIFFFLSLIGLRQVLGRLLPKSITLATAVGIGLYLALIGLGPSGLSVIGGNYSDLIGLGGCPAQYQDENGYCQSHVLQSPTVWAGIFLGGILTCLLLMYRVKGALLIPIVLVAISSWPRDSAVTNFPHNEIGDSNFDFFKQVATWHSFKHLGPSNIDWNYGNGRVWIAVISFLYIDILDTTGTLYAMSRHAGLMDDTTGDFEGSSVAYLVDAGCISIGSLMGLSPSTAFIESASGIAEGGKTGITACTTAFLFFLSLFFAPIFSSIPSWATGSTLIVVGSMMASSATQINWEFPGDAIPAFITIIGIPFTFNIAYGLIGSIITWILLHNIPKLISLVSGGRIKCPGWETTKEPYSISRMGTSNSGETGIRTILPPWLRKLVYNRDTKFWRMSEAEVEAYREGRRQTELKALHRAQQRDRERAEMRSTFNPSALHEKESLAEKEEDIESAKEALAREEAAGDSRVHLRDA